MVEQADSPEVTEKRPSAFDTVAPRVNPRFIPFLRLAEELGSLARISPVLSEPLVEYVTADVSAKELSVFLRISRQAVGQNLERSVVALFDDMFHHHRGRLRDILGAYGDLPKGRTIKSRKPRSPRGKI